MHNIYYAQIVHNFLARAGILQSHKPLEILFLNRKEKKDYFLCNKFSELFVYKGRGLRRDKEDS